MIALNQFDKLKLEGFVFSSHELYEDSLESFNKALEIKEDPQIYYQMAYCYCYLRDYKKAQEYALKAIDKGYDAYSLFAQITVGNLAKVNEAVKVLNEGVEKHFSSACLALANLHIDNNLEPDMREPFEAAKYLELAYEYSKPEERIQILYSIYKQYRVLYGFYPYCATYFKEDRALKYLKEYNKYGGHPSPLSFFNVSLFNELDKKDDHEIVQLLFDRFNGDSKLIFGLLLLEEELKEKGEIHATHDSFAFLTMLEGVLKDNNGACCLMMALCFASDLNPDDDDEKIARGLLNDSKKHHVCIPERFREMVKHLLDHFQEKYQGDVEYLKKSL